MHTARSLAESAGILFSASPEDAARQLGATLEDVYRLMERPQMRRLLLRRAEERRQAAGRLASECLLLAALEVHRSLSTGQERPVMKQALEVLKAGGVFQSVPESGEPSRVGLADLVRQAAKLAARRGSAGDGP